MNAMLVEVGVEAGAVEAGVEVEVSVEAAAGERREPLLDVPPP